METQQNLQPSATPLKAEGKWGISGSTIKIIAIVAMLIDHIAAAVLARYIVSGVQEAVAAGTVQAWREESAMLYTIYNGMRDIGRLGFPIFCFLLVEGYQRTRDVKKYALRLGIFALISDIPFDLAICGTPFHFGYQNVYFTLLLGLLALCACGFFEKCEKKEKDLPPALRMSFFATAVLSVAAYLLIGLCGTQQEEGKVLVGTILCGGTLIVLFLYGVHNGLRRAQTACADVTVLMLCMTAAELLRTDYASLGVLTIAAMYLFRHNKALAMAMGCLVLTAMSTSELPAFFATIPIALYNGRRGLKMKYFFYAFYPVHLLLLYVAAVLLGLGDVVLL